MASLAEKLRKAGREHLIDDCLEKVAKENDARLASRVSSVALIVASGVAPSPVFPTIREIGERWTSRALCDEYPDHVYRRKTFEGVIYRLEKYVYAFVGGIPIDEFTDEHALVVMRGVPAEKVATRYQVGQILQQICNMAVFPLRLLKHSPLPHGFFPRSKNVRAKGWLYPDEEAMVLGCVDTPIHYRVLYGFLHREGTRVSEAASLTWADVDLKRGSITLDENKTNDPRAWALSPGVTEAQSAWKRYRERHNIAPTNPLVFVTERGRKFSRTEAAGAFRKHIARAGVTREVLFKQSASRLRLRIHDARTAFVTVALANGKTEAWVQDRTGHRSSRMINLYRRAARTAAELKLGDFRRLDDAIPKFRGQIKVKAVEKADTERQTEGGTGPFGLVSMPNRGFERHNVKQTCQKRLSGGTTHPTQEYNQEHGTKR